MIQSTLYTLIDGNLPWVWLCAGIILMGLEMLLPGAFLLWIGLAAISISFLTYLLNLSFAWQAILFAMSSGVMISIGRKLWKNFSSSTSPHLNRRMEALIGKTFVLDSPIVNGHGRLKIGDSAWSIQGSDLPAGTHVRVTAAAGNTLIVIQE
jgi:membrane protein implicated in regulation of membrane protease activity